jgi:hypothetical protein
MSNKIKKKLKSDIRFIPFNDKYDFKYIAQYLKNYNSTDDTLYLESNALNSVFFNKYYVQIKDYFNTVINRNKLSKNTFSELIISFANRDLYLINNRTQDSINGKN